MRTLAILGILLAAATLGGCGNSGPVAAPSAPAEQGIYISSDDCAASGKLNFDQCGQAIDHAVALHQNLAPAYPTLTACVSAEGADRCSKGVDERYHPNVVAFLITFGQQPSAMPLYGVSDGSASFKGLDKKNYGIIDAGYSVSDSAQAIANENAKGRG